ncbi:Sodium channel protein type 11 subunit alpha, partial [Durusdinium trenchii]
LKHRSRDSIVSPRAQNHHRPLCGSSMAKYAQNTTCGHTCPWGTGDDNLPPDSFTQAAQKAAAKRREVQEKDIREVEASPKPSGRDTGRALEEKKVRVEPEDGAWSPSQLRPTSARSAAARSNAHPSARSTASQKAKKVETEMESKVMDLINQCLDKKVLELRQLTTTSPPNDGAASSVVKTARSSATGFTTERSVKSCGTEQ